MMFFFLTLVSDRIAPWGKPDGAECRPYPHYVPRVEQLVCEQPIPADWSHACPHSCK